MISVKIDWKDKNKFGKLYRYIEKLSFVGAEGILTNLAEQSVETMKDTINSSRKRPDKGTHNLENSITVEEVLNDPGKKLIIGIGNIDKMNQEASYWEFIDVGGYIPPAEWGYFGEGNPPIAGKSGELWTQTGDKKDFLMKPKKPIEGINYVQKGITYLRTNINKTIEEVGGKIFSESFVEFTK